METPKITRWHMEKFVAWITRLEPEYEFCVTSAPMKTKDVDIINSIIPNLLKFHRNTVEIGRRTNPDIITQPVGLTVFPAAIICMGGRINVGIFSVISADSKNMMIRKKRIFMT